MARRADAPDHVSTEADAARVDDRQKHDGDANPTRHRKSQCRSRSQIPMRNRHPIRSRATEPRISAGNPATTTFRKLLLDRSTARKRLLDWPARYRSLRRPALLRSGNWNSNFLPAEPSCADSGSCPSPATVARETHRPDVASSQSSDPSSRVRVETRPMTSRLGPTADQLPPAQRRRLSTPDSPAASARLQQLPADMLRPSGPARVTRPDIAQLAPTSDRVRLVQMPGCLQKTGRIVRTLQREKQRKEQQTLRYFS